MATRRGFRARSILLVVLAGSAPYAGAQLSDGVLDTAFYFDGKLTLDPSPAGSSIAAVAAAPDGRRLVAGHKDGTAGESTLFWGALDGSTPPTLCSPATVLGGTEASARAALFDAQGRLLLAGFADFAGSQDEGIVLRYLYPFCILDLSFGAGGMYRTGVADTPIRSLALDTQQRIVAGGSSATTHRLDLLRLSSAGAPDATFDGDGLLLLTLDNGFLFGDLAVQGDDRILVGASTRNVAGDTDFRVLRFDPIGDLDGTFSGDGIVDVRVPDTYESTDALLIDPLDGGIVVVGDSNDLGPGGNVVAAAARLTATGAIDSGFGGGDGYWSHTIFDSTWVSDAVLQSDRRILIVGYASDFGADDDFFVYRLTPQGAIDTSFGFLGAVAVPFDEGGTLDDFARAATLDGGKLLVAGVAATSGDPAGAVARLWLHLIFQDDFERGSTAGWSRPAP